MKKTFLFYRLSSMGDVILTTPLLRVLKKNYPDAEIHYIVREAYADVLRFNPYIDKLWTVIKSPFEARELLSLQFDYFIDLHKNRRSRLFSLRFLQASYSTFPKLNLKKFLLTQFKINLLPDRHIVERYFEALKKFSVAYDGEGLDFFLPSTLEPPVVTKPYVAIALGGTYYTKKYPVDQWLEVLNLLPLPVVLLGGKTEEAEGEFLVQNSKNKVYNFCGKLSILESARYINESEVVLTHDTGLMHIAAAFKKPLVSIWGNTVPAFGMYPLYPPNYQDRSIIVEVKNLSCRPCSKLGHKHCPRKHFRCMKDISPILIVTSANRLIG